MDAIESKNIATAPPANVDALVAALTATGQACHAPISIAGTPAVLLPQATALMTFPDLRERPKRVETHLQFSDVASLLAYVHHHDAETTAIFLDPCTGRVDAYLDYHHDEPGWLRHRASFAPSLDPRWQRWKANDRKPMEQDAFAEFIEDNAEDVVKPEAARLVEIITNFKATKNLVFKSAQNLTNGETKLTFEESLDAAGGKSARIEIPEQFEIGLVLIEGLPAYRIKARFRYRLENDRNIRFSYQLIRPEVSERDAISEIVKKVEGAPFATYRATVT